MGFTTLNLIFVGIGILALLAAILYYFYKKKKNKNVFIEPETESFFNKLGLNEDSASINEHFQFPESTDSMSNETFNKFKLEQKKEEEKEEEKFKDNESKPLVNELDKLKKDYEETEDDIQQKKERSFSVDLKQGMLSHEIFKKRNKKH